MRGDRELLGMRKSWSAAAEGRAEEQSELTSLALATSVVLNLTPTHDRNDLTSQRLRRRPLRPPSDLSPLPRRGGSTPRRALQPRSRGFAE